MTLAGADNIVWATGWSQHAKEIIAPLRGLPDLSEIETGLLARGAPTLALRAVIASDLPMTSSIERSSSLLLKGGSAETSLTRASRVDVPYATESGRHLDAAETAFQHALLTNHMAALDGMLHDQVH